MESQPQVECGAAEEAGVTFIVSPEIEPKYVSCKLGKWSVAQHCRTHPIAENKTVLRDEKVANPLSETPFKNGFVGAAFKAYSDHHHLIISPDDVWIAITTVFSQYVNKHAEEMRDIFVSHDGQIELKVEGKGTINSLDWEDALLQISQQIEKNTKTDIREWIEPNFSTTTTTIRTVGAISLMSSMQSYFTYKIMLRCGIPKVTLRGTLEDWELLRHKAERLKLFGQHDLTQWSSILSIVLDQFVRSYSGDVDCDFWNRICTKSGGGSGIPYLEGWILSFIPFNKKGAYILRSYDTVQITNNYGRLGLNEVPISAVQVPVIIDDNGTIYNTVMYAGHLAATQGPTEYSIQPYIGWLVYHTR